LLCRTVEHRCDCVEGARTPEGHVDSGSGYGEGNGVADEDKGAGYQLGELHVGVQPPLMSPKPGAPSAAYSTAVSGLKTLGSSTMPAMRHAPSSPPSRPLGDLQSRAALPDQSWPPYPPRVLKTYPAAPTSSSLVRIPSSKMMCACKQLPHPHQANSCPPL
jgi:hypothetical protein